jgi:hypothetical protein
MKIRNIVKSTMLNRIGLVLSILGVFLMFVFGPPQPDHSEGVGLGLQDATVLPDGRTVAERDRDVAERKQLYCFISSSALGLIGVGFLFQFVATYFKD